MLVLFLAFCLCLLCFCVWTDGKDLFIGKAVQKAYLEVTEEGAEGAVGSGKLSPSLSSSSSASSSSAAA